MTITPDAETSSETPLLNAPRARNLLREATLDGVIT
jgi:hypothetical protein